jgi:hypothetical protein
MKARVPGAPAGPVAVERGSDPAETDPDGVIATADLPTGASGWAAG